MRGERCKYFRGVKVMCKSRDILAVGDAALVWDSLFVVGIVAFAVGHTFYIIALSHCAATSSTKKGTFSR